MSATSATSTISATPRRRTGWLPRWSTIRGRVAIVLAVPTVLLLVLTGIGVADRAQDWSAARESGDRVELALDVQNLVRELQREHGLTSGLLVGAGNYRPELADTRRRVDAIRGELVRRVDGGNAPAFAGALASLDRLTAVRTAVDDDSVDRAEGLAFFTDAIAALNDAQLADGPAHSDQRLADAMAALQALAGATEAVAEERGLLNGVFVAGRFTGDQYLEFAAARAARDTALRSYRQLATDDQRAALDRAFATDEARLAAGLEERAAAGSGGSELGVDAEEWWTAATALTDALHEVQQLLGPDIEDRAGELRAAATRELVGFVVLGLLIVAVAVALAVLASRSITRPLDELTSQAEAVAGHRLPETVRALQEAEPDDSPDAEDPVGPPGSAPRPAGGAEEVTRLAAALHDVERTAIGLAAQQTVLRRNGTESLANLGHRHQALVRRQLRLITALESKELDPDALAELFELDHLATRMRRNADSLLILTGQQLPPRVWTGTAEITEVVRSAVSEVEEYRRVMLADPEPCQVHGWAVYELSHLLAELIENALTASPPGRPVEVYGWWDGEEYCLAVVDRGTGMTEEELARANARLAGEENFLVAPTRFLGHYVVGTIAARLGVAVEVRHTQSAPTTPTARGAGVSAYVALPARLLNPGAPPQQHRTSTTAIPAELGH